MTIEKELTKIIEKHNSGAFLFVGSGLSRRYIKLETWYDLISRFCITGNEFEYYYSSANGNIPEATKLLAEDFHEYWWKSEDFAESREQNSKKITNKTSALRIEISKYISDTTNNAQIDDKYKNELCALSNTNIDGIITTNWDMFLENTFHDYKTYIGQEELLFSDPQGIGEIYKIHGCSSKPDSLVLTSDDYKSFNEKNAYLAAKLITIFMEHPVLFIGYSVSDENIRNIICAISKCIGENNRGKLENNLIFVERTKENEHPSITRTFMTIEGIQIPHILVRTDNFIEIYNPLNTIKRKIPARTLRFCRENFYQLIEKLVPEDRLCSIVDLDEHEKTSAIEYLAGVTAHPINHTSFGEKGYGGLNIDDIINNILGDQTSFDPTSVLDTTIETIEGVYIPIHKYLKETGVISPVNFKESKYSDEKLYRKINRIVKMSLSDFIDSGYRNKRDEWSSQNLDDISNRCREILEEIKNTPEANKNNYGKIAKQLKIIPFIPRENLKSNENTFHSLLELTRVLFDTKEHKSLFRKTVVLYDKIKWGW